MDDMFMCDEKDIENTEIFCGKRSSDESHVLPRKSEWMCQKLMAWLREVCGHHREVKKRASSHESGGIMAYDASDEERIKNDRRERSRWSDGPVR